MPFDKPPDAIRSVLRKIGVDPDERMIPNCQDPEYTSSRRDEIAAYLGLYLHGDIDRPEREVLCCFLLQELNDLCAEDTPHALQTPAFEALFGAGDLHADELDYWMDTHGTPDPESWWPIRAHLLHYRDGLHRERGTAG